ncbi:cupredoxin domain-containing protein [Candidatus Azambacteria bacterium]|nr:cupredoxin domain-containing protein [Candidatus Azambacteria bacterium]
MTKKILLILIVLFFSVTSSRGYYHSNPINSSNEPVTSSSTAVLKTESVEKAEIKTETEKGKITNQCVRVAEKKKNASIKTTKDLFAEALKIARSAKTTSLKLASKLTNKTEKKLAIKEANDKFKKTQKTLKVQLIADKKLALETATSDQAKCDTNKPITQETSKKVAETPTPIKPIPTEAPTPVITQATISNFAFQSQNLTIKKGTTVNWKNNDSAPHTVTGDAGGPASETLKPGDSYSFKFDQVGITKYHCAIHPSMKGTIEVTE